MAKRIEQVESLLKRQISSVLAQGLSDPRLEGGMISVTRVKASPDLHDAQVFVSIMPQKLEKRAMQALGHAARHIGHRVSDLVAMRTVPRLEFRLDQSLKKQAAIYQAIHRGVERESAAPGAQEPGVQPNAAGSSEDQRS